MSQDLTLKLMRLRELLPGVNISMLVSRVPDLILGYDMLELEARLQLMRWVRVGLRNWVISTLVFYRAYTASKGSHHYTLSIHQGRHRVKINLGQADLLCPQGTSFSKHRVALTRVLRLIRQ
jgi:hypothetical protein